MFGRSWQVGGRTASGRVPRAQLVGCMRAKHCCLACDSQQRLQLGRPRAWAAGPAAPCAAPVAAAAEGRDRQPAGAGGSGRGGALRHPPLLQKFKPDWGWLRRPHTSPLGYHSARLGWQVLPTHCSPASFPERWPCLHHAEPGQGQRPRAVRVPHKAPWASSRPLGQAGLETLCLPGLSAPCPQPGNEVLAAT